MSMVRDQRENPAEGIGLLWQCIVFACVVAALFTRRPDMFLHAQFYAEDGRYWYAQAYNQGWLRSLLIPQAGYLQTLPRLVAGLTLLLPFRDAPLVMNLFGIALHALPVNALLSARCRTWGSLRMRMVMATIYVVLPNASQVHVVVTNGQWHVVVLELLLAFGAAPRTWAGRVSDLVLFAIGSISGPFSILLLPPVLFFWWRRRESWMLVLSAVLAAGASLQAFTILHASRPVVSQLGATPRLFLRMIGGNIVLDSILMPGRFNDRLPTVVMLAAALFGAVVVIYGFRLASLPLRLMMVFTAAFFAAAVHAPYIEGARPAWQLLVDDLGCRYYYYPMLVFLWSAVWCVFRGPGRFARILGACVLVPMIIGVARDWRYPAFADYHFPAGVERLASAKPGERVIIPLNPGVEWKMELIKRGR
jgi:hypothetical protein